MITDEDIDSASKTKLVAWLRSMGATVCASWNREQLQHTLRRKVAEAHATHEQRLREVLRFAADSREWHEIEPDLPVCAASADGWLLDVASRRVYQARSVAPYYTALYSTRELALRALRHKLARELAEYLLSTEQTT